MNTLKNQARFILTLLKYFIVATAIVATLSAATSCTMQRGVSKQKPAMLRGFQGCQERSWMQNR